MTQTNSSKNYRRVNLKLSLSTSKKLEEVAIKNGVSKSKLIRQWILSAKHDSYPAWGNTSKMSKTYNLRMSVTEIKRIEEIAIYNDITFSEGLRRVIDSQLFLSKKPVEIKNFYHESSEDSLKVLWMSGRLNELSELLGNDLNKLSIEELVLFARSHKELGNLNQAENAAKLLKHRSSKINDMSYRIKLSTAVKLIEIDIYLYKRDILKVKFLLEQLSVLRPEIVDRGMAGLYYCQLGEASAFSEDYLTAINYYEKGLDYLDVCNHPTLMIRIYVRLARIYEYLLDYKSAQKYFNKVYSINKTIDNQLYWGWFYNDKAIFDFLKGDLKEVEESFKKSLNYYSEIGCYRGECYVHDHFARTMLYQNKPEEAYRLFMKAIDLEKNFRNPDAFSYIKLCKWFIESRDKFEESIDNIQKMREKTTSGFEPSFGDYFFNATKFVNGKNEETIKEGKEGLERLSDISENKLVAFASKNVISTGLLQAIR